jgi:adenylate cyclase
MGMVQSVHTFLFADLCDYTEQSWRHGDDWSAEVAVEFHELVRDLAVEESCEVVKAIGDAVMVLAPEPSDAVRLAQRIHASSSSAERLQVRMGIDTGPAVPRAGDWYGTTVNTAARVAEAAIPGQLLMTDRAREAAGEAQLESVEGERRALKGLPDCLVYAALDAWSDAAAAAVA